MSASNLPHASTATVSRQVIRLDMDQADAQHLLALLSEISRPHVTLAVAPYAVDPRDVYYTVNELVRALDAAVIRPRRGPR